MKEEAATNKSRVKYKHPHRRPERGEIDFNPPSRGIGIDATMKFKDAKFPPVNKVSSALMDEVADRWEDFGLP